MQKANHNNDLRDILRWYGFNARIESFGGHIHHVVVPDDDCTFIVGFDDGGTDNELCLVIESECGTEEILCCATLEKVVAVLREFNPTVSK